MTLIETPLFLRYAAEVWSEDERTEFVDFIAAQPDAGDVVPGAAPLCEVRWSRGGTGKRGGVRVIYFLTPAEGTVSLLIVYSKSKIGNLSPAFLRALRKLME